MIQSFGARETEELFFRGYARRWHPQLCVAATRKLSILDAASSMQDLAAIQSLRLEKLAGKREGTWSIRVNKQWRIVFQWGIDGPEGVELSDDHS
jgi:proteic killer suppression protein